MPRGVVDGIVARNDARFKSSAFTHQKHCFCSSIAVLLFVKSSAFAGAIQVLLNGVGPWAWWYRIGPSLVSI